MNDFINQLAFGWYPYLAVTVMVVGSILRFDANQYGWRSQSSQFLRRRGFKPRVASACPASSCCSPSRS